MEQINPNEKTIVFCATQFHALAVRDLVNQMKTSTDPNYCQRVTADDGALGEQYLRDFQDNEKTIPTILTTSQKLSTGVDARNIRNIVLMRPINTMIEFKQIIGRGTRLYEGKDYFTIYDFAKAHHHFSDPEWDGEPIEPEPKEPEPVSPSVGLSEPPVSEFGPSPRPQKIIVKLADSKARTIQHMMATSFWHPDGTPMSAQQFLEMLFGALPEFFKDEANFGRCGARRIPAPSSYKAWPKRVSAKTRWQRAEGHRRREERSLRCAGARRLRAADDDPRGTSREWRHVKTVLRPPPAGIVQRSV
jgi:type I restriction enzyme R subunit